MIRRFNPSLAILNLHRVVTEEEYTRSINKPMMLTESRFEALLGEIRRHCHPLSLSDALKQMDSGQKLRPGSIAVTFDDGYCDVYQRAYPLLRSYDIPATMFVTTGVVDNPQHYLWWDEVDYLCANEAMDSILSAETGTEETRRARDCITRLREDRSEASEGRVRRVFSGMQQRERDRIVGKIREVASMSVPRARLMLSWDEIRAMSDMFEIACHTVNHPRLSRLSSGEARREIEDAKLRIEQETGGTCRGLAYPSGDFSDDVVSVARSLGFDYAVTTRFGNNKRDADRMRLARRDAGYLYAGDRFSPAYFHAVLSGATDWLRGGDSVRKAGSNSDQREMQPAGVNYSKDGTNDPGARPLVVHVVHHLTVGGLENGLVNLVNRLPQSACRHAIICLTDYSDFRERITTPNVDVHALHKLSLIHI